MDLYFPWLKGFDLRSRFEGQVNFGIWLKNVCFQAKSGYILEKNVFQVINPIFANFMQVVPDDVVSSYRSHETPWTLPNHSRTILKLLERF